MAGGMKRLAKETAVYGLSSILGRLLNWLLVPVYVRVLPSPSDYGIVTNLYAWTALLLILLTCGMETGFFRFVNKKEEENPMTVYGTAMLFLSMVAMLFFFPVLGLLGPISGAMGYAGTPEFIGMLAGIVALDAFCSLPFAYLRYQGKAYRFAGLKLLNIFLNIFLNVFFLILCPWIHQLMPEVISWFYMPDYGVGYIFVSNVVTSVFTFLLLIPEIWPGLRVKADPKLLKRMLSYSFPILILGIAGVLNQTVDKMLFPFLFEDKEYANQQLGIYGACFKIAIIIVMFIQAFRYAYEPFIFARHKEASEDKQGYVEAMKYFVIFSLLIFLGVMFYLDVLKYIIGKGEYYPGLRVVPIVMLGEIFFGIYYNLSLWYKLTDQTRWGAYFSLIGCVTTLIILFAFVPGYGYMACAWASFACNLLMMLLSYFIGRKKFPVPYDLRSVLVYFLLAGVLYAAGMLPEIDSEVLRLLYRTVLLLVFVFFIIKRDLPLREIPYVGRLIGKNK